MTVGDAVGPNHVPATAHRVIDVHDVHASSPRIALSPPFGFRTEHPYATVGWFGRRIRSFRLGPLRFLPLHNLGPFRESAPGPSGPATGHNPRFSEFDS